MFKKYSFVLFALVLVLSACAPATATPEAMMEKPTEVMMEEPTEAMMEKPTEAAMEEPTEAMMEKPTEALMPPNPLLRPKWRQTR